MLIAVAFVIFPACGDSTEAPNTNTNTAVVNIDPANLPPGFSTSPVPLSNNSTPGIPADPANTNLINPKGTPTPGIPDPANINKMKKGTTPTPGIPDPANMRKQMKNIPLSDVNSYKATDNTKVKTVRKP